VVAVPHDAFVSLDPHPCLNVLEVIDDRPEH
jgi:hypothetical protein